MKRTTLKGRTLLCLLSVSLISTPLLLELSPDADARAGRGSSMGSRGSRTYSAPSYTRSAPSGGQTIQRSMTTPSAGSNTNSAPGSNQFQQNSPRPTGNMNQSGAASSGAGSNFVRGMVGGAAGAAAYNMLAGGSRESHAQNPSVTQPGQPGQTENNTEKKSSFSFFKLILLVAVAWFAISFFRKRRAAQQQNPVGGTSAGNSFGRTNNVNPIKQYVQQSNIELSQNDYVVFQQRLNEVQEAWNKQDLNSFKKIVTPEMLAYFSEQLTDLNTRGLHNTTSNIQFQQGDLSEAWSEGNRHYATVSMRYSLIDVTTDNTGRVVEGNPDQPEMITELWTFVRSADANWWLLSAIQQAN